ncbi:Zn(2)-C6 fungal-type domain-containing protein [Mycena indigotica]|uniref:Nucleolar protein 16 n=1 Tax=Mycena indigotica TaxID=2126181 RepID=A0A8H6SBL3_9AGAR|nr:Zn(2)-C6 fungal-type domain-containing protein [Mycena indigotica]KAF7295332.1 Zn(2)-C6 fungal-type domain-containing protein [Mycena indigotica]
MANPRQRRKQRSSTHRAVSHSRHAQTHLKKMPPIRGPFSSTLTKVWDRKKTVKQNYAALGLAHTLNPSAAGGVEPTEGSKEAGPTPSIPKGHGRILRDADGKIVGVELEEEQEPESVTLATEDKWIGSGKTKSTSGGIAHELEQLVAGANPGAGPRHPSRLEVAYLQRLVDKHGSDILLMARDRKLNPEQRTVGELKRALRRCGFALEAISTASQSKDRRYKKLELPHATPMPPRATTQATISRSNNPSTRSVSAPYRRPSGQPKSTRQQYSACGACRMRRVRCDLKDLPVANGPHPTCSNCLERGLKCDEFADVKAVKLLRRGRRLQQVEQIYGKGAPVDDSATIPLPLAARLPSIIPQLKPEFFASSFWAWFSAQRPILDPTEIPARFFAHSKGTHSLGNEGKILMHLLVVWAASFGIDESGTPETEELRPSSASGEDHSTVTSRPSSTLIAEGTRAERKNRTEAMVQEILALIDSHGVMRRPTWDGVRVLLLILPLMEDISISPLDRRCMYEATLNQAAACALSGGASMSLHSFPHASDDSIVRARILWYAYMHEGITTGMRGGRFILTEDDIQSFQSTIPTFGFNLGTNSPLPSPVSPSFPPHSSLPLSIPHRLIHPQSSHPQLGSPLRAYMNTVDIFSIPLELSAVCRRVYVVLTGPRAARQAQEGGGIDAEGMRNIWDGLEQCWEDFESLRCRTDLDEESYLFITAWQIYIFECHNIIRETLKQYSMHSADAALYATPPHSAGRGATFLPPHQLHAIASRKCLRLLPAVLSLLRSHFGRGNQSIFAWDAGLVRDGCFFVGFLCATIDNDAQEFVVENREFMHPDMEGIRSTLDTEEGIRLSLAVLKEMAWAFSKSEEREDTVRRIWDDKKKRKLEQQHAAAAAHHGYDMDYHAPPPPTAYSDQSSSYSSFPPKWVSDVDPTSHLPLILGDRPILPPLSLLNHGASPRPGPLDSAPSTGYSIDGSGARGSGWPTYTPPGTATSGTSTSTGVSSNGSPIFPSVNAGDMPQFKTEADTTNPFFHMTRDLDHFSFNSPVTVRDGTECYGAPTGLLNPVSGAVFDAAVLTHSDHDDMDACGQFGEACPLYH